MRVAVELPALGESVVEGTVSRWLVKEGEKVQRDQPVVEITTDKVDAEIPAPSEGVLVAIRAREGETVAVGTVLGEIETEAAQVRAAISPSSPQKAAARETSAAASEAEKRSSPIPTTAPESLLRATPVARRVAESSQVDITGVVPTGVAGRVTKSDVLREMSARAPLGESVQRAEVLPRSADVRTAEAPQSAGARMTDVAAAGRTAPFGYQLQPGDKVIPMTPLRRLVAEHMVYSKRVSPHVGTVAEIDLSALERLRGAHKAEFRERHGFSLTALPFIVYATVRALREFPRLNASVLDDAIVEKQAIHIGVAVETEKGLVVPVVCDADRLSVTGIAEAVEELSQRARSKKLSPDELKGGTFTVSNPGRRGNLYGFAIINQPQVGILRMGEIVKRPVVRDIDGSDAIVIRPIMHLALSYDHRAVDGAPANGFLFRVRELLEEADFDL